MVEKIAWTLEQAILVTEHFHWWSALPWNSSEDSKSQCRVTGYDRQPLPIVWQGITARISISASFVEAFDHTAWQDYVPCVPDGNFLALQLADNTYMHVFYLPLYLYQMHCYLWSYVCLMSCSPVICYIFHHKMNLEGKSMRDECGLVSFKQQPIQREIFRPGKSTAFTFQGISQVSSLVRAWQYSAFVNDAHVETCSDPRKLTFACCNCSIQIDSQ